MSARYKERIIWALVVLGIILWTNYLQPRFFPKIPEKINAYFAEWRFDNFNKDNLPSPKTNLKSFSGIVVDVVDGDSIKVKNDTEIVDVRLLAVNTLEKEANNNREKCLAKLASEFTEKELLNKNIRLYTDDTQPTIDKYGRVLAYVFIENESISFNERLMQTGLARTYKANPKAREYDKYEAIRKEKEIQKIGIWDENLCK